MPCHCSNCSKEPLPTYSEQFRHEAETRFVAQQTGAWIKEFLEGVEKKRGIVARNKLRKDVLKIWEKK